jgi:hypothetical protein
MTVRVIIVLHERKGVHTIEILINYTNVNIKTAGHIIWNDIEFHFSVSGLLMLLKAFFDYI